MNERFLFRAQRKSGTKKDGEWITGYYAGEDNGNHYIKINTHEYIFVDPATLGQCTGLRDKNGTLVFEGDILRVPTGEFGMVEWRDTYDQRGYPQTAGYYLRFESDAAKYYRGDLLFWICDEDNDRVACSGIGVAVTGNIHDNPELLEVQ